MFVSYVVYNSAVYSRLAYGLGRATYATGLIADFLMDNLEILDEKWLVNLLQDLKRYEGDRESKWVQDHDCDYQHWMKLKAVLREEYKKRGFERDLRHHGLD